jgi:adenylosuccinate synthase
MHYIVVGLGFGDEGKGSLVDYLCRRESAHTVVRFNGGAQAAHNVVLPDGRHHTFAQFGSGTLAGVRTHLSQHMIFNPHFLEAERRHLLDIGVQRPEALLTVDRRALVTTPFHVAANRLTELQRKNRHGSCGMGIGETVADSLASPVQAQRVLRVGDFLNRDELAKKLRFLRQHLANAFSLSFRSISREEELELDILNDSREVDRCMDTVYANFVNNYEIVDEKYMKHILDKTLVFEGAQGVLLDENRGFHPYTTWSNTSAENALGLLDGREARIIGVTRAYHTRHGAGPFPTEDPELAYPDHNQEGPWQGSFRFGPLDLVLLKYARLFAGCTEVAVTCLDHLPQEGVKDPRLRICLDYSGRQDDLSWAETLWNNQCAPTEDSLARLVASCKPIYGYANERSEVVRHIGDALQLPITILSEGPTYEDKRCL